MPLEIKDINWSETHSHLTLNIPLRGAKLSGVDIVSSDDYLKVSWSPYIFEVFLFAAVDEESSKATIDKGVATFVLAKTIEGIWNQLEHPQAKDKEFQKVKRAKAWLYNKEKDEKKIKQRAEEEDKLKKLAVKEQIKLEQEEQKKIKEVKEQEKNTALSDIWRLDTGKTQTEAQETGEDSKKVTKKDHVNGKKDIFSDEASTSDEEKATPGPRSPGTIHVTFTPRVFPTPSRESKAPEEEAWLEKVAAMNKVKNTQDAVGMEEMNPVWLKEKGDGFYKQGNFIAAINAYTAGIVVDGAIPTLYANRSACHLQMKQYPECIQDCTMALELLTPPVPANALSRSRALVRRGTAYFNREEYIQALQDYEESLKICPNNESVVQDAEKIRRIIQGTTQQYNNV